MLLSIGSYNVYIHTDITMYSIIVLVSIIVVSLVFLSIYAIHKAIHSLDDIL